LPIGIGVDLDRAIVAARTLEDTWPIGAQTKTKVEDAPARVGQHVDRGVVERRQVAVGLVVGDAQARVEGAQHEIERGEKRGIDVARAARRKVHLDAAQDAKAGMAIRELIVERTDLVILARESRLVHAARNLQRLRMVGDGDVGEPARRPRLGHRPHGVRAVASLSVELEIAADLQSRTGLPQNRCHLGSREKAPPDGRRLGEGRRLGGPAADQTRQPRSDRAQLGEWAPLLHEHARLLGPQIRGAPRAAERAALLVAVGGLLRGHAEQLRDVAIPERRPQHLLEIPLRCQERLGIERDLHHPHLEVGVVRLVRDGADPSSVVGAATRSPAHSPDRVMPRPEDGKSR
jgi:hypothetical protein